MFTFLSPGLSDALEMIRTVTAVCINGLEEAKGDPDIDGEYVEVLREEAVNQRSENGSSPQNEDFRRVSVFSCQSKRCRVLMMNLMNVLIKRPGVKRLVSCSRRLTNKLEEKQKTYRRSGKSLQRKRKRKLEEPWFSTTGMEHDMFACQVIQP